MLNRLKSLLGGTTAGAGAPLGREAVRLAAAALLVEAASMDGNVGAREAARILELLRQRYQLSAEEADELLEEARSATAQSTQLYEFTRSVKDSFDHQQRVELIEMLWEVAYADGQLHDYESNLVRRVSGLIYVSDQDSGAARKRAMARLGLSD